MVGAYSENYIDSQNKTIVAKVGLPTIGEMFSGNDIDMSSSNQKTFVDVNTIENPIVSNYYWTMNKRDSLKVNYLNYYGYISTISSSGKFGVRPVIYLKKNLTFTGGDGTAQNPYTLD